MKNIILSFLLGIFVMCSIAATVPNDFITVKPQTPKSVVVYNGGSPENFIPKYTKQGYIVKSTCHSSQHYCVFVVMEKY